MGEEDGGLLEKILKRFQGLPPGVTTADVTGYEGEWPGAGPVIDQDPQRLRKAVEREKNRIKGRKILQAASEGRDKVDL